MKGAEPASTPSVLFGRPRLALALLTVALLLPFAGKAFHIDDPLFIWTARHITGHPFDFYGFHVNWWSPSTMMLEAKNPPLAAYLLALVGSAAGWSETALHLGFLPVAVAAVLGSRALAARFSSHPDLAALTVLFAPAFLVSATTLMCDALLLALYVWAVYLFARGLDHSSSLDVVAAGLLAALAALTKYFGATLVPLLLVYGLLRKRRPGAWTASLLIPIATLGGYQWLTRRLYGRGLLTDASSYALTELHLSTEGPVSRTLVGLAFAGACLAPVLFFLHRLWRRRWLVWMAAATVLVAIALVVAGGVGETSLTGPAGPRWGLALQIALWAAVGVTLLALAISDWRTHRDPDSVLLGLWLLGTLCFAAFLNWTINARSVLPMAPAVGILLARRLRDPLGLHGPREWRLLWPLLPAAVLAVLVAVADFDLAGSARAAAETIHIRFGSPPGRLWFEGHWGFQYYMQAHGHELFNRNRVVPGDRITQGGTNYTRPAPVEHGPVELLETLEIRLRWPLSTMNAETRAGFYSDRWGTLPFVFGSPPPERYKVVWIP